MRIQRLILLVLFSSFSFLQAAEEGKHSTVSAVVPLAQKAPTRDVFLNAVLVDIENGSFFEALESIRGAGDVEHITRDLYVRTVFQKLLEVREYNWANQCLKLFHEESSRVKAQVSYARSLIALHKDEEQTEEAVILRLKEAHYLLVSILRETPYDGKQRLLYELARAHARFGLLDYALAAMNTMTSCPLKKRLKGQLNCIPCACL